MGVNQFGKCRDVEEPYAVYTDTWGQFETRVLKTYQQYEKEQDNPNARWFVAVKSRHTYGCWQYGDQYARNVPGELTLGSEAWIKQYGWE